MATKTCSKCKEYKALDNFANNKRTHDGKQNYCKECAKQYKNKWVENNGDEYLEREKLKARERRKDPAYLRSQREYKKQYHVLNRDKIRKHTIRYYHLTKEWRGWKFREAFHKRKAMKEALKVTLTNEEWEQALFFFNHKCAYCGSKKKLTQEHIIPVVKEGDYTKENIIPACGTCNSSKRDKDLEEWYFEQPFFNTDNLMKIYQYITEATITR